MTITIHPITRGFAAEIGDLDASRPLSKADEAALKQALWDYAVLVLPDQELSTEQHVAFAQVFGPVEADRIVDNKAQASRFDNRFSDVSNLNAEGKIWDADSRQREYKAANRLWHTDSSFRFRPGLCSVLYGRVIPPIGGQTEFADERAAYEALDAATQERIAGLIAEHSLATSRRRGGFSRFTDEEYRKAARVPQLLVRVIPETSRKTLYLASHIGGIHNMPWEAANQLLDELIAHATQRQFVYTHRWRPRDVLIWDNRCTMHRGMDYDDLRYVRDMRRVTIADVGNTCEQAGITPPEIQAA
jgi:alpha-ketoglutarate-dependent 2,4-dichlorophenoxyacetate dioxygenase